MAMRGINPDPGCVYDTLAFLSKYLEEAPADKDESLISDRYYREVKQELERKGVMIPHYLLPFFYRKGTTSFLYSITLDRPYGECMFERLKRIIKNQAFMKRSLTEYYFPHTDSGETRKLLDAEHPGIIDLLRHGLVDPALESYLLYAFLRFEDILCELYNAVEAVYGEIADAHQAFLSQTDFTAALRSEPVLRKLRAIAGTADDSEPSPVFSLSLMDKNKISYHPDDPSFFLLGYDFELSLEREYRYSGVTPYTFAQSISNPAKYDIFRVLMGKPLMTAADISKRLHLSKNALTYNLKEMQESGVLTVDHVKGLTFYYKLDYDYLQVVSEQLGSFAVLNK